MPTQHLLEQLRRYPSLRAGLDQLLEARQAAETLKLNVWTMAVEMSSLLALGCTTTQLRLLVGIGHLEHAEDVTDLFSAARSFQPENPMRFGPQTCFVLTDCGVQFLASLAPVSETSADGHGEVVNGAKERRVPVWDAEARELRDGSRLVKQFRRPAPMLELVLAAFQELNWPHHLDDPLPPKHDVVPSERLRDTVRRLNHCQHPHTILFSSDGLGAGIRWCWADQMNPESTEDPHISHGVAPGNPTMCPGQR